MAVMLFLLRFLKRSRRKRLSTVKPSIRVVVLGSARVGKTAIIKRLVSGSFSTEYKETIEDMYRINVKNMELEIVDTTGVYIFPAMRELAIRTADAFVLVFAWDDADSLENVKLLLDTITEARESVEHIVIAGNKMDVHDKAMSLVQTEMVVRLDWGRSFQECSAKSGENVRRLFEDMVDAVAAQRIACSEQD